MERPALPGEVGEGFVEHVVFEQHPKDECASQAGVWAFKWQRNRTYKRLQA